VLRELNENPAMTCCKQIDGWISVNIRTFCVFSAFYEEQKHGNCMLMQTSAKRCLWCYLKGLVATEESVAQTIQRKANDLKAISNLLTFGDLSTPVNL